MFVLVVGCGYHCNVCIQDFVVSVVLVWLLHICKSIYMWDMCISGAVTKYFWGCLFSPRGTLFVNAFPNQICTSILVSTLGLRYCGLVVYLNMYRYVWIFTSVGLLFCCFVSFGLCLALAWKCLYICIIGFVVLLGCGCWVVVLVMACRCRYIHAFFCLLLVVSCVLCRSDICFIYIYAMFVLVAWLWVPV